MSYPPVHYMHIHQRPKLDTTSSSIPKRLSNYLRSYRAYNYRHRISCMGWFDTASCDVLVHSITEGLLFLEQFIACSVKMVIDNPAQPAWEGFINRMTFSMGKAAVTISLDEMGNRITVKYMDGTTASTPVSSTTATADSTTSQSVFGIKHGEVEFGYTRIATPTAMGTLRDTLIANRAYPATSLRVSNGQFSIHIEMLGWYHTLKWDSYSSGAAGTTTSVNTFITSTLLPSLANGKTFFDNTDFGDITSSAITFATQQRSGATFWDLFQQFAETGDGSNGWITGITPTSYITRERRMYFRAINLAVEYTLNMGKGLYFQTVYGKRVPPWLVLPDRGVRIEDWLLGYGLPGDDPRFSYIYDVSYDANSQSVTFNSQDDTTLEGVFDVKRQFKRFGKTFGARIRWIDG